MGLQFFLFSSKNVASGCAVGNRAENIGRRLASQQSLESGAECAKRGVLFSPCINEKVCKKGKYITEHNWGRWHFCKANVTS